MRETNAMMLIQLSVIQRKDVGALEQVILRLVDDGRTEECQH